MPGTGLEKNSPLVKDEKNQFHNIVLIFHSSFIYRVLFQARLRLQIKYQRIIVIVFQFTSTMHTDGILSTIC